METETVYLLGMVAIGAGFGVPMLTFAIKDMLYKKEPLPFREDKNILPVLLTEQIT